jgi:hypothetical protein
MELESRAAPVIDLTRRWGNKKGTYSDDPFSPPLASEEKQRFYMLKSGQPKD